MFALEWCEFCWSVRKLFKEYDIPYRSVDLDSADYQEGNWGGEIRNVLKARTRLPTIPQIFVGGEHIGGCTETFDAFNDGRLQKQLQQAGIAAKPNRERQRLFVPAEVAASALTFAQLAGPMMKPFGSMIAVQW